MKKNILIIGLAGVLGTFIALSSCGPDYETEFSVLSLTIPSESQAAIVFPLAIASPEHHSAHHDFLSPGYVRSISLR